MPTGLRISGSLNVTALEDSLSEILRRHAVLRSRFPDSDGEPVQLVGPPARLRLNVIDLQDFAERDARRIIADESQSPFDLAHGPLVRASLLLVDRQDSILLIVSHHIVSDGWSVGVLFQELTNLYSALGAGRQSMLAEPPIQYADYSIWQRAYADQEVSKTQLDYWKKHLSGIPAELELPADRIRPSVPTYSGATESFRVGELLTKRLRQLSRNEGATLFMTLLGAFQVLLSKYAGHHDIVVGTPIAGRTRLELEQLIGLFANTLVIRTDLSGPPGFAALLRRVRDVAIAAYANQETPFERIVEELRPERSLNHQPLFQVMFSVHTGSARPLDLDGARTAWLRNETDCSKFDLSLVFVEAEHSLEGLITYSRELFDEQTAKRFGSHLEVLLDAIVTAPDRPITGLSLLTSGQNYQILREWNDTEADLTGKNAVHKLFEEQVCIRPDSVAAVCDPELISYQELNSRADRMAQHLTCQGVGHEVLVGLAADRSIDMLVGLLGILKAGGAYVAMDPLSPRERLQFILDDSGASLVLTHREHGKAFGDLPVAISYLDSDISYTAQEHAPQVDDLDGLTLAYVIYTSGSTGKPKGVAVEHRQLLNYLAGINLQLGMDSCASFAMVQPISVDSSATVLYSSLIFGGALHLISAENALDAGFLADYFQSHDVDGLKIAPSHLAALQGVREPRSLLPRRRLVIGGEASSWDWVSAVQSMDPACVIFNHYGPTETTVGVLTFRIDQRGPREGDGLTPLGRPLANTKAFILDFYGQIVPPGVMGELYIGGSPVSRGYLKRPDLTALLFVPDGVNGDPGARLYRTGDLCKYLAHGVIEFVGRIDGQTKIRGFRIEPGEIESALSEHPAVAESVVQVRLNASGERYLAAYFVITDDARVTPNQLRIFLRDRLPPQMIPAEFVEIDALPLTPHGKVDRRALPSVSPTTLHCADGPFTPRDEVELQLQAIWERILQVKPVALRASFFDLGGHSLLAVRLMAQMEATFGQKVSLAALFQSPTIEDLADIVRRKSPPRQWSPAVAIQTNGCRRPLFCVHPAGGTPFVYVDLARHLQPDRPFYAFQARGLEPGTEPLTQVRTMAADYVSHMRGIQSEGPYLLSGWSMGGLVVFEMAQQLIATGESVALIALFDTAVWSDQSSSVSEVGDDDLVDWFALQLATDFGIDVTLPDMPKLEPGRKLNLVLERAGDTLALPGFGTDQLRGLFNVFKANFKAARTYEPKFYPGQITLFRPSETLVGGRNGVCEWEKLASDVRSFTVAGNHYSMIREPNVREIAEHLIACIEESDASVINP